MLIYSFIADYQAFSLRYKDNTTRDKNETKVGKQSANLGKNNEPIQNRLSFLIDCKSVILHHLAILSFPMVRLAWDNWWLLVVYGGQRAGCQLLLACHGPLVQCPALRQPHGARHACPQSHGFLSLLLSPGSCGLPSSCRPSRLMVSRRQAGVCQASPRTGRGYGPQGRCPTVEGHQGKPHL